MLKLAGKFAKSVFPGVVKPLHILWNEMIGFVFLMFAVIGAFNCYRYITSVDANPDNFGRFAVTAVFTLVMGYFAGTSFWKARKIGKR